MGRSRGFDEREVISQCAGAFLLTGYEGTSIDDLVHATGLHRGSLYKAFGSKRGLFLATLRQLETTGVGTHNPIDLLLVALLELAPRDAEVREMAASALAHFLKQDAATTLGARLLERAQIDNNSFPTTGNQHEHSGDHEQ